MINIHYQKYFWSFICYSSRYDNKNLKINNKALYYEMMFSTLSILKGYIKWQLFCLFIFIKTKIKTKINTKLGQNHNN